MLKGWLPWRWLIRWATRRYGLIDPAMVLARFRRFAEPSEVHEPLEIMRAWMIFHARGVVNTRAIQHNLDWVWPYWVEKQFNPRDPSFIPRAHSLSHINMTHRNWTAVGLPGFPLFPLVDPRGLVTPMHDGWSLDAWLIDSNGQRLLPSRSEACEQKVRLGSEHAVETRVSERGMTLQSVVEMHHDTGGPRLDINLRGQSEAGGKLVVALRPYNPEGIQFIDHIERVDGRWGLSVNNRDRIGFDPPIEHCVMSCYAEGDVSNQLDWPWREQVKCDVGMATAAAVYSLDPDQPRSLRISVPLTADADRTRRKAHLPSGPNAGRVSWSQLESTRPQLRLPDERYMHLFDTSARTLLLLSPHEVYPGAYTYRRFWYRDACLMLNALLTMNQVEVCRVALDEVFPARQRASGYYESQEGEWDSNGQVLWLAGRFVACTEELLSDKALKSLAKAARWLDRKRLSDDCGRLYDGLLPAGFSAEHLGPNNHYYWDNYWAAGGLRSASKYFKRFGREVLADDCHRWAEQYLRAITRSLDRIDPARSGGGIPAAPNRRMDAGAIGSVVADYPLQLLPPGEPRMQRTLSFLMDRCRVRGAFFQDMTHSGMNAYLTLHLAQALLRAGDDRYADLMDRVADLASPTGLWPEAVHPLTETGCMGDGQHGWAAAEWVLMVRALFCREEGDGLVIGSGLKRRWIESDAPLQFGPTLTPFGPITVTVEGPAAQRILRVDGNWPGHASIRAQLPGYPQFDVTEPGHAYPLSRSESCTS